MNAYEADGRDMVESFAEGLRQLRAAAGEPSYRALAITAHYSRTTLAQAANGRALPSLDVTMAFVRACHGNVVEWEQRWQDLDAAIRASSSTGTVASAWPLEPVVDGADPESSGCSEGAVTVHTRKVALTNQRHLIGQIELRYSPRRHAVWGRSEGYGSLDHFATHRHEVEILVRVTRESDGVQMEYRSPYSFDYHWCDVLVCTGELFVAHCVVVFDGTIAAQGETDPDVTRLTFVRHGQRNGLRMIHAT